MRLYSKVQCGMRNAQAQQRERRKNCSLRGGRGEEGKRGRGEERGVAAVGFTCSRSGMIARTALPCRSCPDRSVALAEAPEVFTLDAQFDE